MERLAEDAAELGVEDGVEDGVEGTVDITQPGDGTDQARGHETSWTQRPRDVHHEERRPTHQEGPWGWAA